MRLSNKKTPPGALKIRNIINALEREYGVPERDPDDKEDPLEQLVRTILSQNTNDLNRDRAFESLHERFSSWDGVVKARPSAVEAAIRVGGLAEQKSRRIQAVLRWVKDKFGEYSLEGLKNIPPEEAHDMLISLDGVGPKTAAIVMLFSLGEPFFPVDTHVHRVTGRLGLLPEGADAGKAHGILAKLIPAEKYYSGHLNFIAHGKKICSARKPKCSQCVMITFCPWPAKHKSEYI
jgi:endonuclease-3